VRVRQEGKLIDMTTRFVTAVGSWSRRPSIGVIVTAVLLALVWVADYASGPSINLSIAYFAPIIYAAWAIGRNFALVVALVSEMPTYIDQTMFIRAGSQSTLAGMSTIIVRLLVYLFVVYVTSALIARSAELKRESATIISINKELRTSVLQLEEDLRIAGELQESVMEFLPPNVPGCEVGAGIRHSRPVGGDFADAGLRDGRVYICVADISGKGVPAALFSVLLKHLLMNAIRERKPLPDLISDLDSGLSERLPADRFVTLFYAEVDPQTGIVEYVNAGHLEGVVCRCKTGEIELAGPTQPLLGLSGIAGGNAPSRLQLERGDVLAVYTDGATESKTTTGERLGEDMVRGLLVENTHLRSQEMVDRVLAVIESRTEKSLRDDLTLVCAKRTDAVSAPASPRLQS